MIAFNRYFNFDFISNKNLMSQLSDHQRVNPQGVKDTTA